MKELVPEEKGLFVGPDIRTSRCTEDWSSPFGGGGSTLTREGKFPGSAPRGKLQVGKIISPKHC